MNSNLYIPAYGDVVYLSFDPSLGHEQKGRRPAIIVSSNKFIKNTKLCVACPISNADNNFPLHIGNIKYMGCSKIEGYILTEHIRVLDYVARNVQFIEKAPNELITKISAYIHSFFEEN